MGVSAVMAACAGDVTLTQSNQQAKCLADDGQRAAGRTSPLRRLTRTSARRIAATRLIPSAMPIPSAIRRAALALTLCICAPATAAPLYFATPLGSLGGADTLGTAINAGGQVTGASNRRAFVHSGGIMTSLGTLGGEWSGGYGINARGDVTGASAIAHSAEQHAFYYTGGAMLDISPPGTRFGVGNGINASGVIVGTHDSRAFRYTMGTLTVLPTLGGPTSSGLGINDAGQIVGGSEMQPCRPAAIRTCTRSCSTTARSRTSGRWAANTASPWRSMRCGRSSGSRAPSSTTAHFSTPARAYSTCSAKPPA
jgi:probable HAF family extracellular repeat protein